MGYSNKMGMEIKEQMVEVKTSLHYLTQITEKGFKEVHKRQDTANGKVLKHETQLISLKGLVSNCLTKEAHNKIEKKELKDEIGNKKKVLWSLIGAAGTVIAGLIIQIITKIIEGG